MPRLSVNINKIATLRNTRRSEIPSLVRLAAQRWTPVLTASPSIRDPTNAISAPRTWTRWPN